MNFEEAKMKYLNSINSSRSRERDKLDKILLILSAGTLSLSATFINQSSHIFIKKEYLFISWFFLIIGLTSHLFSYIFADIYFKKLEEGVEKDDINLVDKTECWNKVVTVLNWISFTTIVLGIIFLTLFSFFNI
jgi:hypothetical protein